MACCKVLKPGSLEAYELSPKPPPWTVAVRGSDPGSAVGHLLGPEPGPHVPGARSWLPCWQSASCCLDPNNTYVNKQLFGVVLGCCVTYSWGPGRLSVDENRFRFRESCRDSNGDTWEFPKYTRPEYGPQTSRALIKRIPAKRTPPM